MRQYLKFFFTPVIVFIVLIVALAILAGVYEPIDGDLTRISGYSERDFGWKSKQPVIEVVANARAGTKAEILVLGDSFSEKNIWQSVLAKETGYRLQSFDYKDVGCIDNWLEYALGNDSANILIVETVERKFLERFRENKACQNSSPKSFKNLAQNTAEMRISWPPEIHVEYTLKAAFNALAMRRQEGKKISGKVINVPVDSSCANFSNLRSDRLLYYPDDEDKLQWKAEEVAAATANVLAMNKMAREHGKTLVFVLVPDKLSVYGQCIHPGIGPDFTQAPNAAKALGAAGVDIPDLQGVFKTEIRRTRDLYFPNNTHLSWAGYKIMAQQIEGKLPRRNSAVR